ncbi:Sensor protein CpxA [Roseovarius sp. THAF27]|uniref:HAMP domain-containing sensor histidine kinase n=1 Tax=Roseovarius sp. THAF27 TaxID=2587850 RepID=UPI00126927C8|nr:ATP-binding protein [Roseovarius sp. THAF27]QFT82011.1 Sensor protein CpxA [Roseovarius sp. THAF27]
MRGMFLKALTIIIVTVVGSVIAMALILHAYQTSPATSKLELQKREIALDLAATILSKNGAEAANQFVAASEDVRPLGLFIGPAPTPKICDAPDTTWTRTVLFQEICYRVVVDPPEWLVPYHLAPMMLGLAILVSSIAAAALLARNLVGPIALLRDGLSALAQGRFNVRIAKKLAHRKDEMALLASNFDCTAERLHEHRNAQRRLFHDISHELRSPLSRLQAATGILRKNPAKLNDMLERIDREVGRLDTLIGEVLTLARLSDRSEIPMVTQRLDVIEILNEILSDAAFEAQAREVSVTTEVDGAFLADVDGELIYRALENVIRNATKYSADASEVQISSLPGAESLTIEVTDQGPGVRKEDLDRIFRPFSRGTAVAARGGYGLGLAIARKAVEQHGGQIWAETVPHGGLKVTLNIPRTPLKTKKGKARA